MPAVMPRYIQGPADVLDYPIDALDALAPGEQISSATFTVPSGLTKVTQTNTTTNATVWLSGGTPDTTYTVTCALVTNQGRTYNRSFLLQITQR